MNNTRNIFASYWLAWEPVFFILKMFFYIVTYLVHLNLSQLIMMFVLVIIRIITQKHHREKKILCKRGITLCCTALSAIVPRKNFKITRICWQSKSSIDNGAITKPSTSLGTTYCIHRSSSSGWGVSTTVDTRGNIMRSPNETRCVPGRQIPIQLRSLY